MIKTDQNCSKLIKPYMATGGRYCIGYTSIVLKQNRILQLQIFFDSSPKLLGAEAPPPPPAPLSVIAPVHVWIQLT